MWDLGGHQRAIAATHPTLVPNSAWPLQGFADLNGDGHKEVVYIRVSDVLQYGAGIDSN